MSKKPCCKCKTTDSTVLIRHAYYCQDCFVYAVVGKYRTIINKSRAIARVKGKVLLALSGGPSSIAMLDLTKDFMHVAPHEKKKIQLLDSALICHIDESCLFDNQEGSTARLEAMAKQVFPNMGFVAHGMDEIFSSGFMDDNEESGFAYALKAISGGSSDYEHLAEITKSAIPATREERVDLLKRLFDGISKNSAKEDLYWHLKQAMLVKVAQREKCSYIFVADSATRQAIKMISMTSKGRGYSIPLDVGAENDMCFPGIAILRPMKDMLAKEIALYNRFSGLDSYVISPTDFGTRSPVKASIEKLTEHFIATLDRGFPSTVSTISRTASKLTPQQNMDMNRKCAICSMPYESGIESWRRQITVSRTKDGVVANDTPAVASGKRDPSIVDLNQALCYSCQVDLKDYKTDTIKLLPPYAVQSIVSSANHDRLREQIKDFLIEDDDNDEA